MDTADRQITRFSLLSLFIVSMVALGLEIILTRVFSVVLFASHSFMAISLALLGTGAGAIIAYLGKPLSAEKIQKRQITILSLIALSIVVSSFILLQIEFVPLEVQDPDTQKTLSNLTYNKLSNFYTKHPELFDYQKLYSAIPIAFLPFFLAGYLQAIIFRFAPKNFGKFYGVDLIGATVGSLSLPLLLYPLGLVGTVIALAFITTIPIIVTVFTKALPRRRTIIAAATPLVVSLCLLITGLFQVKHTAGFAEKDIIRDYWTPFSRVALMKYAGRHMYVIDSGSRTFYVPKTDRFIKSYTASLYSTAFEMKQGGKALIIASGGGQEIVMASHFGMQHIDAVEIAGPIVRDIVNKRKNDPNNPYLLPNVNYYIADGRSVAMRSRTTYDIIEMLEVNCWTMASQIAQSWSPYFVFTQEAFSEYLQHLNPDGYLCYTIFSRGRNPVSGKKGRRFRSVIAGMKLSGIERPEDHIIIMSRPYFYGNRTMVLVKKTPFSIDEMTAIREKLGKNSPKAEILYPSLKQIARQASIVLPDGMRIQKTKKYIKSVDKFCQTTAPITGLTPAATTQNLAALPINDDRPYLTGSGFRKGAPKFISDLYRTLLITIGVLMLVFILLPFVVRRSGKPERLRIDLRLLLILIFTGLGFMFVEMTGIYKYQLYLHHPTLAMIMVLSSMILGAGIGSIHSERTPPDKKESAICLYALFSLAGIFILLVLIPLWGHRLMLLLPLPALISSIFILFTALGFLLGHIVPLSIAAYSHEQPNLLAWCWAITVTGSVCGTVLASIISREYGMFLIAVMGLITYTGVVAVSLAGLLFSKRRPANSAAAT